MDVGAFLGRFAPFDSLDAEALQRVASHVQIEYFPEGRVILEQSGRPSEHLYVVRAGAVEVRSDGRLLDLIGEGESFGAISLVSGGGPTATIRAHEDTLCYLLDVEDAREVLGTPSGLALLGAVVRRRMVRDEGKSRPVDPYLTTAGELVRREPVICQPDVPAREAAEIMTAERVSSLLIPAEGGWGIVTDRDLRTRVLAAGRSPETPVGGIMTSPAATVAADTVAAEVLLRMLEEGVHHFPVIGAGGRLVGMVTDTDLMGLERQSPFMLRTAIERAPDPDAVAAAGLELPATVRGLVEGGADPVDIGMVVSLTIDVMTVRLIDLAIAELGPPPASWAWLAMGSHARREQALRTDQDHSLAHDGDPAEVDPYFGELGVRVVEGLEAAGIPRCEGDIMASNRALRRSLDQWVEQFRAWMGDVGATGSVQSSICFDFRRVHGPLQVEPALDAVIAEAPQHPHFLRRLASRALDDRPPTGFFRDLVVEAKGEHSGTLDVKHRGITLLADIARAFSIGLGNPEKRTLERLRVAAEGGAIEEETRLGLDEAFRLLWRIRLDHQAAQLERGATPDDHVDPKALGPLSRQELKEAFRIIARAQRALAGTYGLRSR